ncbi:glycoside hydrolase family 30 beta sandwich domain-containing protein [Flammeovirga sp. SJP92]|uniref:glycoside hydrolase family 30 protein n=1 Tax=Flammeovirga sp. SJP92 TaxID=1775430 RepID=UPI0007891879|nr:glycoside hydrolase family 30 beta sandwich domain-containing protein [Flammeovirga sp. SJP92]KXX70801.1 glucosylceramidase [Flammeovirga sp. SJP92]
MKKRKMNTLLGLLLTMATSYGNLSCSDNTESTPVAPPTVEEVSNIQVYVTTKEDVRGQKNQGLRLLDDVASLGEDESFSTLRIDKNQTYQEIDGFGYTLTGGSAMHINNMSSAARIQLLKELFGNEEKEIGVNYLRVSVGASDLDAIPFSYAETEDETLNNFTIAKDKEHLIPVLKEILAINPSIKILGSPWSPPTWMKTNNDYKGGSLMESHYGLYADYFVKYIQAYAAEGITIDAITVQNEPLHPGNVPSLLMKADEMANFIAGHLGPKFQTAGIATKIITYDHNCDRPDYPISIINSDANQYINGSAFHLYAGDISALSTIKTADPTKEVYFTEQWVGANEGDYGNTLMWHFENMFIGATRNWSKTVLEWNLAADSNLQPHTDGGCTECLGALTIDGNTVDRNVAYYTVGQASKFIPTGSYRIKSNNMGDLPNVSFLTPEGKVVTLLMNNNDTQKKFNFKMTGEEKSYIISIPANSVGTMIYDGKSSL